MLPSSDRAELVYHQIHLQKSPQQKHSQSLKLLENEVLYLYLDILKLSIIPALSRTQHLDHSFSCAGRSWPLDLPGMFFARWAVRGAATPVAFLGPCG